MVAGNPRAAGLAMAPEAANEAEAAIEAEAEAAIEAEATEAEAIEAEADNIFLFKV